MPPTTLRLLDTDVLIDIQHRHQAAGMVHVAVIKSAVSAWPRRHGTLSGGAEPTAGAGNGRASGPVASGVAE